ncbi:uncharacterized protein [Dermacentor albipictus]|uniref:uncharacterized protein n=1 Tax=Dermacentor albipictus TaxID=60249 RepID=UPI0031FDEEB1
MSPLSNAFMIIASAAISTRASFLADEVLENLNVKLPQYHLQVTQSSCSLANTCNMTCAALVAHDATFAWYLNGEHQAPHAPGGSVGRNTIQNSGRIELSSDISFVYSTLVILEKAGVTKSTDSIECHVMLLDENWSTVSTVKLKGDVVTRARRLHAPLGSDCLDRSKCVGRHVTCQHNVDRHECHCNGSQFVKLEQLQACLRSKKHGQRCLFEEQCRSSTQKCDEQSHECVCSETYHLRANSCSQLSRLHGLCDKYRLCPDGSWCADNICSCKSGYYEWNGECEAGLLSEERGRSAMIALLMGSSVIFALVLIMMGYYFHKHSYNPSSMFDRAGSTWDPATTTKSRTNVLKHRAKSSVAVDPAMPVELPIVPPP